jgi:uncharacterized membrane protein YfcA
MPTVRLAALVLIFFCTSIVSVVTGSTSLITVPALILFGVEPRAAIATNMFALVFLSAGGSLPFLRSGRLNMPRLPVLAVLTVAGSIIGAILLSVISASTIPVIVFVAMIAVIVFSITNPDIGVVAANRQYAPAVEVIGYGITLALGVYGGFFSGGYVTLLTAACIAFFGMTFLESIGVTKVMNLLSSLVATLIFMWRGLVDYKLAVVLGLAALAGGLLGARFALRLHNRWLRRIFLGAVTVLAVKLILLDLAGKMLGR